RYGYLLVLQNSLVALSGDIAQLHLQAICIYLYIADPYWVGSPQFHPAGNAVPVSLCIICNGKAPGANRNAAVSIVDTDHYSVCAGIQHAEIIYMRSGKTVPQTIGNAVYPQR